MAEKSLVNDEAEMLAGAAVVAVGAAVVEVALVDEELQAPTARLATAATATMRPLVSEIVICVSPLV
jgi:hypothetical protein